MILIPEFLKVLGKTYKVDVKLVPVEGNQTKSESCASVCSADGSAAPTPSEAGVQADGPERFEDWLLMRIEDAQDEQAAANGEPIRPEFGVLLENQSLLSKLISLYRSEVGAGQDARSRPSA